MDLFKFRREQGNKALDSKAYGELWHRFGGSVITHPEVIERVSRLADMPLSYRGWYQQGELVAAAPVWGKYLAGSKVALKKAGKRDLIDMGNGELILPVSPQASITVRYDGKFVSSLHENLITTLKRRDETCVSLLKGYQPGGFSKKFKYNQRREWRLFQEQGGYARPIAELDASDIATIYCELFEKRWGFAARGAEGMANVISQLKEFLLGDVLYLEERPAAIQLVYQVEAPEWFFCEYVNGGVEPEFRDSAPGSVLTYLNTFHAWEQAEKAGKALRYSFGKSDREYKDRWCQRVPVFEL